MKNIITLLLSIFLILFFLQSCQVEKRHYLSGYNVEWNQAKKKIAITHLLKEDAITTIKSKEKKTLTNGESYNLSIPLKYKHQMVIDNNKISEQIAKSYDLIKKDNVISTVAIKFVNYYPHPIAYTIGQRYTLMSFQEKFLDINKPLFHISSNAISDFFYKENANKNQEYNDENDNGFFTAKMSFIFCFCAVIGLFLMLSGNPTVLAIGYICFIICGFLLLYGLFRVIIS